MNNRSKNTRNTGNRSRRGTSDTRPSRRGRLSRASASAETFTCGDGTGDTSTTRNYKWTSLATRTFLELIIGELEAEDYTVRIPVAAGKRRIEEKFLEKIGDAVKWEPEMKGKFTYLKKLWYYNNILPSRSGVGTFHDGQIDMVPLWWADRIAEFSDSNRKYITVLQNKALPFKDLLDIIHGKHDVDQDDRYSPHMLGVHLDQSANEEVYNDDVLLAETEEHGRSSVPPENSSARPADDDLSWLSRSPSRSNRQTTRHSPRPTRTSSGRARNSSTRRTHMRRVNFETQIDKRFQRMEESRGELMNVVRSRQTSKPTYGDALGVLESLPIEPMNTFWWEANKLIMNDEDIRDGFMKLKSKENKIHYLERLAGVDRYGNPCDLINLRVTSSTSGGSFGGGSVGGGSTDGGSVGRGSIGGGSVGGG